MTEQAKASFKTKESEASSRLVVTVFHKSFGSRTRTAPSDTFLNNGRSTRALTQPSAEKLFSSLIYEDDVREVRARWRSSIADGKPWQAEFRLKNVKTNTHTWFSGHTIPLRDQDGNIVKWIGSASDISAQKQMNETLSALVNERDFRTQCAQSVAGGEEFRVVAGAEFPSDGTGFLH